MGTGKDANSWPMISVPVPASKRHWTTSAMAKNGWARCHGFTLHQSSRLKGHSPAAAVAPRALSRLLIPSCYGPLVLSLDRARTCSFNIFVGKEDKTVIHLRCLTVNVNPLPQKTSVLLCMVGGLCSSLTTWGLVWSTVLPKPSWPCSPQPHVITNAFSTHTCDWKKNKYACLRK